jgi:prophage antirepressor-like protein
MVNGEPLCKGKSVATILGYTNTKRAILMNVDEEHKQVYKSLVRMVRASLNFAMDAGIANDIFINESGLYSLIIRSNGPVAEIFKRWVCSDVLPSIRKTGSYSFEQVQHMAKGENKLHYDVIKHIKDKYPVVVILAGLGEYQDREFNRIDACFKGFNGGQPDIILLRKLSNDFIDVIAIELKNHNGSNSLSEKQVRFIQRLEKCKVETLVSNDYDNVIVWLHDHYREIGQKTILSINGISFDFSIKCDPKY